MIREMAMEVRGVEGAPFLCKRGRRTAIHITARIP